MKVAAVQMTAGLARIEDNLERAKKLLEKAFLQNCQMVILPEFFSSAVAFHPDMLEAVVPLRGEALKLITDTAQRFEGYVGGSFIASRGGDNYNTFVLAFPDGRYEVHDKDQPTMWENCYYKGGSDDGILETPLGPVGVALCWELIRTRTARRLRGRVGLVVGGSCWWTLPNNIPIPGKSKVHERNVRIMEETPARLARLVGAPVIHAAHAGTFEAGMPLLPGVRYRSGFLGETQVVDAHGKILARLSREDGEGLAVANVEPGLVSPAEDLPRGFWIPRLPVLIRASWEYQNLHGGFYYRYAKRTGKLRVY